MSDRSQILLVALFRQSNIDGPSEQYCHESCSGHTGCPPLHFVGEHFNDARHTRAATAMLAQIARSLGQAASVAGLHQTRDVTRWHV
jgi:hypothetical protein